MLCSSSSDASNCVAVKLQCAATSTGLRFDVAWSQGQYRMQAFSGNIELSTKTVDNSVDDLL
jgi:hypothetical protein